MSNVPRSWGISPAEFLAGWWNVLNGRAPLLSIEITSECPLNCPGCYAYGEQHLGAGAPTLREVNDFRGEALIQGVLDLVRKHRPLHVSLVGGEPMVRHKELSRILPALGEMGIHTLLVTSAVIPIPQEWMGIPRLRIAVSVDGLPEHHNIRRKPATYERVLRNIQDCTVNVHWTITRPMLARTGYLEEYLAFWSGRDEVNRIWASIYSPQVDEYTAEILTRSDREALAEQLPRLRERYPKFLMNDGIAAAFLDPPQAPDQCLFSRMSTNYTADLTTRIEPCVLGGTPDCGQCGCAASVGLHWVKSVRLAGPLKIDHLVRASMAVGRAAGRLRTDTPPSRWLGQPGRQSGHSSIVQIAERASQCDFWQARCVRKNDQHRREKRPSSRGYLNPAGRENTLTAQSRLQRTAALANAIALQGRDQHQVPHDYKFHRLDAQELAAADSWFQSNSAPLLSSATFQQDGLLAIVFDEIETSD